LLTGTMTGLHGGDAVRFAIAVANVTLELLARHPRLVPSRMPPRMSARGRPAATDDECESHSADDEGRLSHENLPRGEDWNAAADGSLAASPTDTGSPPTPLDVVAGDRVRQRDTLTIVSVIGFT
jgi:hypothetical protein